MTSQLTTKTAVTAIPAADPPQAEAHFASLLAYETDCSDVHQALETGEPDFVLLDVRSPECFREGHIPGAVNIPHGKLVERNLQQYAPETLFVVYCAGPRCNGADKGARRLASLGRYVKKMVGGIDGWKEDGYSLTSE